MSKRYKDMFYMKRLSVCACPSLKNRLKKLCGEKPLQGFCLSILRKRKLLRHGREK